MIVGSSAERPRMKKRRKSSEKLTLWRRRGGATGLARQSPKRRSFDGGGVGSGVLNVHHETVQAPRTARVRHHLRDPWAGSAVGTLGPGATGVGPESGAGARAGSRACAGAASASAVAGCVAGRLRKSSTVAAAPARKSR